MNGITKIIDNFLGRSTEEPSISIASKQVINLPFRWPKKAMHLLALLQDGLVGEKIPTQIQDTASKLLEYAFYSGTIVDRKWALEVGGIASESVLLRMLAVAFKSESRWLNLVAYRQVAKLGSIPKTLSLSIRKQIVRLARTRQLWIPKLGSKSSCWPIAQFTQLSSHHQSHAMGIPHRPYTTVICNRHAALVKLLFNLAYSICPKPRSYSIAGP